MSTDGSRPRGRAHRLESARDETCNLPQIESRFPIAFPNSARSPHQRGLTTAAKSSHRLLESPEIEDQQRSDGVSFARISFAFQT